MNDELYSDSMTSNFFPFNVRGVEKFSLSKYSLTDVKMV